MPSASSWGFKGYNEVWLSGANDWIYRHLHAAADRMVELADTMPAAVGLEERVLNQAARELLLAQSSDWAFIMSRETVVPYAVQRTKEHLLRFHELSNMLRDRAVDEERLREFETKDNLFPAIDYRVYSSKPAPERPHAQRHSRSR
jgi:1,4-alpha-glucan branching enzyme